jgi:hypothetical protein
MEATAGTFKYRELTIDDVLAEEDFRHLTKEQAKEVLFSIEQFASILFDIWKNIKSKIKPP